MSKIVDYVIVISSDATESELRAAAFVRDNVRLVCGRLLPIVRDSRSPSDLEIVVGETSREKLDGLRFDRYREPGTGGIWEYVVKSVGSRLYLTGLGLPPSEEPEYTSAYRHLDDGRVGTVMAAYHFVERILGYDFLYGSYIDIPEDPLLEMPSDYEFFFTREAISAKEIKLFDSAAMYVLSSVQEHHVNTCGMIFKTRGGKIAVLDGGRICETDTFLQTLKEVTGCKIPHVDIWLFSHLHVDHFGVYYKLCTDESYKGRITVGDFYCNLLTEEFYTTLSRERVLNAASIRAAMLSPDSQTGAKVHTVKKGDTISVDEISFEVIHIPDISYAEKMNMNDSSVVYKMTYDESQTILLLGDSEWVCSNDLVANCADKLKSDVVQVAHHGCGNVSYKCYELIDADAYIWQISKRFWYGESGEGLNTHNTGVIRTRAYMMRRSPDMENVYVVNEGTLALPLPIPIKNKEN